MLEKKEKTCCILINHEILLIKLEYYGVRVIYCLWINEFIFEWVVQCVKISQTYILIYINNDIYKLDPNAAFHLFSDDTTLFCANKNINQLKNNIIGEMYEGKWYPWEKNLIT